MDNQLNNIRNGDEIELKYVWTMNILRLEILSVVKIKDCDSEWGGRPWEEEGEPI